MFKTYKDKKSWNILVKNQVILQKREMKYLGFNKKTLKIEDFNDAEEQEVNEKNEKRKIEDAK